ncbi:MAG TPA: ferrochelatase [Bacteroidia bacterium]|nr:ferrochelatase [Bacteroidia bacterium]HRH09237.1 ferrochelatase [Bacteroidia bacterium]
MRTGVLLVNLGTPNSPSTADVRTYLSEFLNDPRVIDIPMILRKLLVNLIIVPFRSPKSAKIYQKLWTKDGSPLLIHGNAVKEKLQQSLSNEYEVFLAMRYQNPSLDTVLAVMQKRNFDKVIVLPLFPQYASSSTGSALEKVMQIISKWYVIPELKFISQYYNAPGYIQAFAERGKQYNLAEYDHILFSYHGLPVRQVDKVYGDSPCSEHHCEDHIDDDNKFCYKATCYETTRLIAKQLNLKPEQYSVAFQSRLDKKWLEPFSDKVVIHKAKEGAKKMLVFSPAFVADCLETTIEIGEEYNELFKEHGGEKVQLVESLNDHPIWINTLKQLVEKN